MPLTFDATLKDLGRESPAGFLAAFDRPPTLPFRLLNVDLSAVTRSTDLVVGLGEPLEEIIHLEFQSSASAWKHADLLVYNALLYAQHHVPVHTIVILLRPEAAHPNLNGRLRYAPRPEYGSMDFGYRVVRLWEEDAEKLLAGDLGLTPLAMLGRLPESISLEDGLGTIARRLVERLVKEASSDRAARLLTTALLLTGLRVPRNAAASIFRGVRIMEESDTYLMILDEGKESGLREAILIYCEDRLGPPDESVMAALNDITDLERLKRLVRQAPKAINWRELVETP